MHFHKFPYAANFEFVAPFNPEHPVKTRKGNYELSVRAAANDVYHLRVSGKELWNTNDSQAGLKFPKSKKGLAGTDTRLVFDENGAFKLEDSTGKILLESLSGRFFGQSGNASIFELVHEKEDRFYGMGAKWTGLEHSGKTTKFWNTDVWADFNRASFAEGKPDPDPVYVSIPYLIIHRGDTWLGLLLDNPHATFINTGSKASIAGQLEVFTTEAIAAQSGAKKFEGVFHLGAEQGQPNLYVLYGPTLPELTRKLQTLIGTTPRPPAWALGYHQCRWGYQSEKDLLWLDGEFRKHGIPVDGLWLDIDYMEGYRVFTFAKKHFRDPAKAIARVNKLGRKVVPIIDPGVKHEAGYRVYESGKAAGAFCLNPQGGEYVGLVWPGQTLFPDYSIPAGRAWWAAEVAEFARLGIFGAWLDMNDPATGAVDNQDMLFDRGRKSHSTYHNQYALGMAQATREGFLAARPEERPFLLCRSGYIGSNRYTAIWTGDNFSNYHHLKNSIATTLNLALSGIPFNGPDAGGFGGDTTPELMRDWFKAGFLFPVFRNHSITGSRQQEPWAFDTATLRVLKRFIQLRYRFRPYLYNLFIEHERTGEAILRPLFYDFSETPDAPLAFVDDQFLVGPSVLQAPFVVENQKSRQVVLPAGAKWFGLASSAWLDGGQKLEVAAALNVTPIYIRDGSILPLARSKPEDHTFSGAKIDFHVFLAGDGTASARYVFDDGKSFAYETGQYSEVEVVAERSGASLTISTTLLHDTFGPGDSTFSTLPGIRKVTINGKPAEAISAQGIPLGAKDLRCWR